MVVSEDLYLEEVGGFSLKLCKIFYCVEFIRIIKNFLNSSCHKSSETCPADEMKPVGNNTSDRQHKKWV